MTIKQKIEKVQKQLQEYQKVIIAYSGGIDSTLLALLAKETLAENHLAVTADSHTYSDIELAKAKKLSRALGFNHIIIKTDEFSDSQFLANPFERCYYCKNHLFKKITEIARLKGYSHILDGNNADDGRDFRPGRRAAADWSVKSPLAEAGLTKDEIRKIARHKGLPNWNTSANSCLASRIPYGIRITEGALKRIEASEEYLKSLGMEKIRVRCHDDIARIEVEQKDFDKILTKSKLINARLKKIGFKFVSLDLGGYQMGCFNPKGKNA
jgi:uncharacterized protein